MHKEINEELSKPPLSNINIEVPIKSKPHQNHFLDHTSTQPSQQKIQQSPTIIEETYYVSSFRQNILILVSDNLQVIEFPVGVLKSDIGIGDPIKLKLQYDVKRAQKDRKKFENLQENLLREYTQQ